MMSSMGLRYKIGNEALVVANNCGHGFAIGTKIRIAQLFTGSSSPHYRGSYSSGKRVECCYIGDDELADIKEDNFSKLYLKLKCDL